jgi:hypothetical protein
MQGDLSISRALVHLTHFDLNSLYVGGAVLQLQRQASQLHERDGHRSGIATEIRSVSSSDAGLVVPLLSDTV